ncbi:hypothetical protein COBT_001133, partial [Conglomerata obtusa]
MRINYIYFLVHISQIQCEKHQNVKVEDFLARIDAHNASTDDAIKHCISMNHSSLFIHVYCDAHDFYPIQPSIIINYIVENFFAKSKFPPIDVFAL